MIQVGFWRDFPRNCAIRSKNHLKLPNRAKNRGFSRHFRRIAAKLATAASYGLDTLSHSQLLSETSDYRALIFAPDTAIGERAAAIRALKVKVKELLAALLPIDRLIIQYQTTPAGEAFVAAYLAARTFYDRGDGPGEEDPAPAQPPSPSCSLRSQSDKAVAAGLSKVQLPLIPHLAMPDDEIKNRKLCAGCVAEAYLRNKIILVGCESMCIYCGKTGKTIRIEEFAEFIESAFVDHYGPSPMEPSAVEIAVGDTSEWEREGESFHDIVSQDAGITVEIAEDIRQVLSDRHFDSHFERAGEKCSFGAKVRYTGKEVHDTELQINYSIFERRLKTEARFFDGKAMGMLDMIFENLSELQAADDRTVIVNAGPGTGWPALFRAREFQTDDELKKALITPAGEIGPPPPDKAKAGRMNAHGIATFYGASDAETARAEVIPAVGSRVVVARFEIIRSLRLLDVESLRMVLVEGSMFDRRLRHRLERARFLKSFSEWITRPIMPDAKDLEFVPTQVIAGYLAEAVRLDGVIYPSAQTGGIGSNVALFHKAASVETSPFIPPKSVQNGSDLSVNLLTSTEDGQVPDYWVDERLLVMSPLPQAADPFRFSEMTNLDNDPCVSPALRLDLSSVQVHHIEGVQYAAKDYPVTYPCYDRK